MPVAITLPPACREDPYELEEWLTGQPEGERRALTLGVLAELGHESLQAWKEHHAFGIGMGRSLDEFPEGTYAFYFMPSEPGAPEDALPEELEPVDLEVLGAGAGLSDERMAEMDDETLSDRIEEELGAEILGDEEDGCYKLAEAASLRELILTMASRGLLGIDGEPSAADDTPWPKGGGSPLSAIRDRRLRRVACGLSGAGWQMFRTDDPKEADASVLRDCQRPLLRRADREFILGWFGLPPAEMGQACILCCPDGAVGDDPDEDGDA